MRYARCLTALLAVLAAVPAARGTLITVPLTGPGGDSGWNVTYDGAAVDVTVDLVRLSSGFVVLEIAKDFTLPPDPETGAFPSLDLVFTQRLSDAATTARIIVADESITNLTGRPWTDFHWAVLGEDAWLDVPASGRFGVQPPPHFQAQAWTLLDGDPSRASALEVLDGLVAPRTGYFPGTDDSDLVIRADLSGSDPVQFTLKEYPTPEPATVCLMGLGALAILARRRR